MRSLPVPSLGGRVVNYPQGQVAGGTGSINGMLYVRSHRTEHEAWVRAGCTGWSFAETRAFYEKAESGADGAGPAVHVSPLLEKHELAERFIAAAQEAGMPALETFNGPQREGVGRFEQTRRGRFRAGPGQTALRRARRRPNVQLFTDALCRRILFDNRRAIGVEIVRAGQTQRILARREVVVASGALRSPQLLQVSGIGPCRWRGELSREVQLPSRPTRTRYILRQAVGIVHIFVPGQSPEHGLAKLRDQRVAAVLAGPGIGQDLSGQVCQAKGVIEIPKREQASVGRHSRTVEF